MKFKLIHSVDYEMTIVTEDGGVASIRYMHEEDRWATTDYYQSRITNEKNWDDVWKNLSEGKMYYNDWEKIISIDVVINDALSWLCPTESQWENDPNIFPHLT